MKTNACVRCDERKGSTVDELRLISVRYPPFRNLTSADSDIRTTGICAPVRPQCVNCSCSCSAMNSLCEFHCQPSVDKPGHLKKRAMDSGNSITSRKI